MSSDVAIIGGGAAGLAAAYFAASHGARVRVFEKNSEPGKKILISGGTRCNVLPLKVDLDTDYFTSSNRNAVEAVFSSWDLQSCYRWMTSPDGLDLDLEIEVATAKYFPKSNSAKEVRDALLRACQQRDVDFVFNSDVRGVKKLQNRRWMCVTKDDQAYSADRVVMASGGRSYPKLGTEGTGYSILSKLGHTLNPPFPALTPLFAKHPNELQLAGVSLQKVGVTAENMINGERIQSKRSGLLFTHRGFSGPAILDISHSVTQTKDTETQIQINWISETAEAWEARLIETNWKGTVTNYVQSFGIPFRLSAALCQEAGIAQERRLSHLKRKERKRLIDNLVQYLLVYKGHGGYRLAEVTGGGVPFDEIESNSLESTKTSGLFICGELMDIFGRIGGFNFYWAWLSGRLAGISAVDRD